MKVIDYKKGKQNIYTMIGWRDVNTSAVNFEDK